MEEDDLPLFVSEVLPSFLELDFAFVLADLESEAEVDADVLPLLDEEEPVLPVPPVVPELIEVPDVPVPEVKPELDEEPEEVDPDPLMLEDDEPGVEELLEELFDMLLPWFFSLSFIVIISLDYSCKNSRVASGAASNLTAGR